MDKQDWERAYFERCEGAPLPQEKDDRLPADVSLARDVLEGKVRALETQLEDTMDGWRGCMVALKIECKHNRKLRLEIAELVKGGH